ncbi:putative transposase/invertase (TIGR01784 family) [Arcicella aurantiaca]|uniref:Putative transposase/invertase (TIGR01784 family) n=1 Tax=Arcicella aurantiaca TaxID=591202 RepID=A0A316DIU7_9BACT|nr:Rpn family recombination-promoting nuclease/putative transposase [Arcicella aurantiaca]PWK18094.1 putative transposase/invertase (TIGR01784 family) [Arcicella aurantiaca]
MATITNPHDKFFKESFSRLEVVQSFIQEVFPAGIKDKINLSKLQLTNSSFTDADLSEHLADLVYKSEYAGQEATITLLFEHKSYREDFPQWQLLRYMTNIWQEEQKQKQKSSVIIPIIIHHGNTNWNKITMRRYFENPPDDLLKFLPEFDYLLFSLNDFEDYQIANFKNNFLSTTAMLLKHSRDEKEQFLSLISFWTEKLNLLEEAHEIDFIRSVFTYIDNGINLTTRDLTIIFTKVSNNVTNIAMTIAEEIKINTTIFYVKGLLKKGFDAAFIADTFELPVKYVEEIIQKIKESSN